MKGLIVGLISLSLTGCFGLIGTEGAIRQWGNYQNGALAQAKAANEASIEDGYWNHQQSETQAKIWRFKMGGVKNDK